MATVCKTVYCVPDALVKTLSACTPLIVTHYTYCTALHYNSTHNIRWHIMSQWPVLEDTPSWCGDAVQCAALYGLGLLHQGTSDRLVTEMLIGEIAMVSSLDKVLYDYFYSYSGNITASIASTTATAKLQILSYQLSLLLVHQLYDIEDRESYSLSAGLALGMVNICKGNDSAPSDLHMDERLHTFIHGGKDSAKAKTTTRQKPPTFGNAMATGLGDMSRVSAATVCISNYQYAYLFAQALHTVIATWCCVSVTSVGTAECTHYQGDV
eukprot:9479-Heterococcus_DN1.PRE.2